MRKIAQEAIMKKVTIALGVLLVLAASPNQGRATCEQEMPKFLSCGLWCLKSTICLPEPMFRKVLFAPSGAQK